jgi:hypothetical protein
VRTVIFAPRGLAQMALANRAEPRHVTARAAKPWSIFTVTIGNLENQTPFEFHSTKPVLRRSCAPITPKRNPRITKLTQQQHEKYTLHMRRGRTFKDPFSSTT